MKTEFNYTPLEKKLSGKIRKRMLAGQPLNHIAHTEGITLAEAYYLLGTTPEDLLEGKQEEEQETESNQTNEMSKKGNYALLTKGQKNQIKRLAKEGVTRVNIADTVGCSTSTVQRILSTTKKSERKRTQTLITQKQKDMVFKLNEQGVTHREIAKEVGVGYSSIHRILKGAKPAKDTTPPSPVAKQVAKKPAKRRVTQAPAATEKTPKRTKFSILWGAFTFSRDNA